MKKLLIILLTLIPAISKSQVSADNISLNTTVPLVISYSSVDELLSPKVLHNAIEIKLNPNKYSRNIMAHINFTGPQQNSVPADWVSLKLASKTSGNSIVYKTQNTLSASPVLLFSQPPSPSNEDLTFYYDVVLSPLNTFTNTGSFNFSGTVSILQQ